MAIFPSRPGSFALFKPLLGIVGALALLSVVGYLLAGFLKGHPNPKTIVVNDDPRLTFPTPFGNVRTEVKYIGDDACVACHPIQSESFRHSPMGRSLLPVSRIATQERYDLKSNNPFEKLGFFFQVDQREGKVYHRQARKDAQGHVITEHEDEVAYVLGSGNRGRCYLFNREGHLYQSPISWFSGDQTWASSPGFVV